MSADASRVRIVVDTNLLVSGVISAGGPPRQLVNAAQAGSFELCTKSHAGIPILTTRNALDMLNTSRN